MSKSINNIKLELANTGKLNLLNEFVPINIHKYGQKVLGEGELCGGVTLSRVDGQWYATLAVEIEKKKPIASLSKIVGVDLGIKSLFIQVRNVTNVDTFTKITAELKKGSSVGIVNRLKMRMSTLAKYLSNVLVILSC